MPRRGGAGRRKRARRAPAISTGAAAMTLARSALKGFKYLKGLLNVEYKNYDKSFSPTTDSTGTVTVLTDITQGDAQTNRNGNSCRLKSLLFNYTMVKNGSASTTFVRLIIFQWFDDTNPTVTTVLEGANVNSPLSIANSNKYRIKYDKKVDLDAAAKTSFMGEYYRKLNYELKWTAAGSTAYKEGHLWVLALSDQATNVPTVSIQTRVRFVDN